VNFRGVLIYFWFVALSVAQRRIMGWLVNGEMERVWIRLGSRHLHEDAEGNRERESG
jgi:hypothetical protein